MGCLAYTASLRHQRVQAGRTNVVTSTSHVVYFAIPLLDLRVGHKFKLAKCRCTPAVGTMLTSAALGPAGAAEPIELAQSVTGLTVHLQVQDPEGGGRDPTRLSAHSTVV